MADVVVIGGGLAGLAASIHLAKAGFRVQCIEPEAGESEAVGESLDWSAPALLEALGLPMERLIDENFATYKRKVTVKLPDGTVQNYIPGEWLAQPPYNVELRTLHVDRNRLDRAIREIAVAQGVEIVEDRVVEIEKDGKRVAAVKTASGRQIPATWFIDASGSAASLFPRDFHLPVFAYGPKKVGMWAYFKVPDSVEGTTLYMDPQPPYMEWLWEIPVHPNEISVGFMASGDTIKEQRQRGLSVDDIFRDRLSRIPRFLELLPPGAISPRVTSFQCRVHSGLAGPNWLVAGESASMVDPMTANGVTAALRHAAEAAALIVRSRHRRSLPYLARTMYSKRIVDLGRFFNCGIERTIYDRAIRNRIGVLMAGRVYTVPAWVLNSIYSRLRPDGPVSTVLYGFMLAMLRAASAVFSAVSRRERVD